MIFLFMLLSTLVIGQNPDTVKTSLKWHQRKSFKVAAVPMALTGMALITLKAENNTQVSKENLQEIFLENQGKYYSQIDDQLRYAPMAMVYGLNLVGIKGKNNFAERTIILSKIFLIQHLFTSTMKKGFAMERPNIKIEAPGIV